MKNYARNSILGIMVVVLSGCGSPELTRRYKGDAEWPPIQETDRVVDIGAFSIDLPPSKSVPPILRLAERGQAQLIDSLSGADRIDEGILEKLKLAPSKADDTATVTDLSIVARRIVFSIETNILKVHEADRISAVRCTLNDLSNDAKFHSWDRFESVYETVDLGKLTLTQGFSASVTPTETTKAGSGDVLDLAGTVGGTRSLTEELNAKARRVLMTGRLTPSEATITQEGAPGIDLTGNFIVDIKFELPHSIREITKWANLKDNNGHWSSQNKLRFEFAYLKIPSKQVNVAGNLTCQYVRRKVIDGHNQVVEGKQEVEYVTDTATAYDVALIDEEQTVVRRWFIQTKDDTSQLYVDQDNARIPVYFGSYRAATAFLEWLKDKGKTQTGAVMAARMPLMLEKYYDPEDRSALDPAKINELEVRAE